MIQIDQVEMIKFKKIPNGDSGVNGICFFYGEDKVLKIFYDPIIVDKEHLIELSQIQNDSLALPIDLVKIDEEFSGYIMNYVKGDQLVNLPRDYSLGKFISCYEELISNVEKASNDGIRFSDLHHRNIILGDKLYIVDASGFGLRKPSELLTMRNLESVNSLIYSKLKKLNRMVVKRAYEKNAQDLLHTDSLISTMEMLKSASENVYEEEATFDSVRKLKLSHLRKI